MLWVAARERAFLYLCEGEEGCGGDYRRKSLRGERRLIKLVVSVLTVRVEGNSKEDSQLCHSFLKHFRESFRIGRRTKDFTRYQL
eukprot:3972566-Prorocentrum_lima.AAC.1